MTSRLAIYISGSLAVGIFGLFPATAQQATAPPAPRNTPPPEEVGRLTLTVEEIRRASSSVREEERRQVLLEEYKEMMRRKAMLEKDHIEAPRQAPLPKFGLKENAEETQRALESLALSYDERKAMQAELSLLKRIRTSKSASKESSAEGRSTPVLPGASANPATTSTPGDSALRDYTSSTTRKLQEYSGTNSVIRPLGVTLTFSNRNYSTFNRTTTKPDEDRRSLPPVVSGAVPRSGPTIAPSKPTDNQTAGAEAVASFPGSYPIPTSPLDVIQPPNAEVGPLGVARSSLANPQSSYYLDPYQPATPSLAPANPLLANTTPLKPGETTLSGADKQNTTPTAYSPLTANPYMPVPLTPVGQDHKTKSGSGTPSGAATTTTVPGGSSFPTAPFLAPSPLGANQPLGPLSPIRKNSGPNSDGYYEPKSITDLQYGR